MYNKEELSKKSLEELRTIAGTLKVSFSDKVKKDDLAKLILESQKVIETVTQKKEDLHNNPTSQSSSSNQKGHKIDFFHNIPELSQHYGKDKIVFMVRDPHWGFVYWEVTENLIYKNNISGVEQFLRVYDINGGKSPENPNSYFDIKLVSGANNWYINFPSPNTTYIVDLGFFRDGVFITLLRSNAATTPRDDVSDQIDVEWMMSDDIMKKLLKASGADQLFQQMGSQELMKFLAGNITEGGETSSGLMPNSFTNPNLSSSSISSSMNKR